MPDSTDALFALQTTLLLDLLRENESTAVRLLRLYAAVFDRLTADWLKLLADIEAQRKDSTVPTHSLDLLLFQQDRIRQLRASTALQIQRFAREAEPLVKAEQRMAVKVGAIHAERLMQESAGVSIDFAKLPTGALEALVGRFGNGEPLRALFDQLGPDAAFKAEQALFGAVATGQHPTIAARQLRTELGVPLTRSIAISRTEMLGAYRSANLATYAANSDVVKGWRWNAHLGPGTCSACLGLHGSVHPLSETFFPGHVNCRCSPSPVTGPASGLQTGPDWFADQSKASQLRVLGPGKLALYQDGKIDLEDLVFEDFSPRWGASFREGSIAHALAVHDQPKPWQVYE